MPDPTRAPPIPPENAPTTPTVDSDRPTAKQRPARDVQHGAFDDSAAGEEDPGASIDTMTPRPGRS